MADHKDAVKYFCDKHKETLNRPYFFFGGRDGKIIKVILECVGIETFKTLVDLYFETKDYTWWDMEDKKHEVTHGINHFMSKINWLRSRPNFNEVEKKHTNTCCNGLDNIVQLKVIPKDPINHQTEMLKAIKKAKELTA